MTLRKALGLLVAAGLASAGLGAAAPTSPARTVSESNGRYDFDYAYPAPAAVIPGLKAFLEADLRKQRERVRRESAEGQAEAKKNGYPFNPYLFSQAWSVVAQPPGWLSLSAALSDYSGGAHGMHWFATLLWDKRANRRRMPLDLFQSPAALAKAIRAPFCDALDRERERRREAKVNRASGDMFDECIDPTEQTLILGSRSRLAFDRIGVLVAPYAAGPYVEGDYEVTVPVTAAVIAAVKPEFRSSFAAAK